MFIMIDGLDGSGKSTVVQAWKDHITQQGNAIFDLKKYMKETGHYPALSEFNGYDFVFSSEPTYVDIGAVIRNELIKNGSDYSSQALAEAYSLDRLILYEKIIIPLLKKGKTIIQDRGISSSLAYQSISPGCLTMRKIAKLSGNDLALKNRPDYLVIVDTDAQEAIKRLANRTGKQDNAIFENLEFLKKAGKQFLSKKFKSRFTKHGSRVVYLNGNAEIDIMKVEAIKLLEKILNQTIC